MMFVNQMILMQILYVRLINYHLQIMAGCSKPRECRIDELFDGRDT